MTKSVVIIGAGAAGIAAAVKLIKNGFQNVIILEANDRIGGRIHTIDFGGSKIDLGAQWYVRKKIIRIYQLNVIDTFILHFLD